MRSRFQQGQIRRIPEESITFAIRQVFPKNVCGGSVGKVTCLLWVEERQKGRLEMETEVQAIALRMEAGTERSRRRERSIFVCLFVLL